MAETAQAIIPSTTPSRTFQDHKGWVQGVAVFPDGQRMVTGSCDKTLRLWDLSLKDGSLLKKMEGHISVAVAVSRDGEFIASGGYGEMIAWLGDVNGKSLTKAIKGHSGWINSLDFSPDGSVLASGSCDQTTRLWNTKTWQQQGNPIDCGQPVLVCSVFIIWQTSSHNDRRQYSNMESRHQGTHLKLPGSRS